MNYLKIGETWESGAFPSGITVPFNFHKNLDYEWPNAVDLFIFFKK